MSSSCPPISRGDLRVVRFYLPRTFIPRIFGEGLVDGSSSRIRHRLILESQVTVYLAALCQQYPREYKDVIWPGKLVWVIGDIRCQYPSMCLAIDGVVGQIRKDLDIALPPEHLCSKSNPAISTLRWVIDWVLDEHDYPKAFSDWQYLIAVLNETVLRLGIDGGSAFGEIYAHHIHPFK